MAITIGTNLQALCTRNALDFATAKMNRSMIRLSTGSRINSAKDDPTGSYVASRLSTKIRGIQVAYQNVAEANNILATAESSMEIVRDHLDRIKELAEQCSSSSVSAQQKEAIKREVQSRVDEINRIASETEFNDLKLLNGDMSDAKIQVGTDTDGSSSVTISNVFGNLNTSQDGLKLFGTDVDQFADVDAAFADADSLDDFIDLVDDAIDDVTTRISYSGIYQSRFESISNLLIAQNENMVSAYGTITDTDIATETTNYVKYQILQQTASSLLTQANQTSGSLALRLINAL